MKNITVREKEKARVEANKTKKVEIKPVTLAEMVAEIKRENALRRNLYPQWKRKATQKRAEQYDRHLEISEAIEKHLENEFKAKERLSLM